MSFSTIPNRLFQCHFRSICQFQIYFIPMDRVNMARSLDTKPANFQKDVIIPEIYDLQNIKLIQSCNFQESPKNKVLELKKKNINNIIRSIINKPTNIFTHDNRKKQAQIDKKSKISEMDRKSYQQIYQIHLKDGLFMDIDEHLGESIAIMEENFAPTAERITGTLNKVQNYLCDKQREQNQKQVQKYIFLCENPKQTKILPEQKEVKGLIQQLKEIQRNGVKKIKIRSQSAKITRKRPQQQQFKDRQSKSRLLSRSTSNLNKQTTITHIHKSNQLITMINTCLNNQSKFNNLYNQKIGHMKHEWGKQSKLYNTLFTKNLILTSDTLSVLKQKRMKSAALARIDNQYLKR